MILAAIGVLVLSFIYLGPFLAIAAFLLFGLALPIYMGWKRPRHLAVVGLVVLLVGGPLISLGETALLRAPSPPQSSAAVAPYGVGGSVLQNAYVTPFAGAAGGLYSFRVDLHPNYLPNGSTGILLIILNVSTCQASASPGSAFCGGSYPYVTTNQTFSGNGTYLSQTVYLNASLPGSHIWYFQMEAHVRNRTSGVRTDIPLDLGGGFNTVQGPVTGSFASTLGIVIPAIYETIFFYQGLVFYIALLIYTIFKVREARRKALAASGPIPGDATAPGGLRAPPAPTAPSAPGAAEERRCPNCSAVVYPNEAKCWKCGADLTGPPAASSAPLPSSTQP